jgi:glycosyltransferase involved in cell wall biosynthesis
MNVYADSRPLVSVVIPCFNQAPYVGAAIASAHAQTYENVEVVVVDDGSTDGSSDVIASHDVAIRLRQPNGGVARARNAGLAAARGHFVVFLDADDRLLPRAVEIGAARLGRDDELAFAAGVAYQEAADGGTHRTSPPLIREAEAYADLLRGSTVSNPASALFRRSALDAVGGYDDALRAAEDYELYLRLARNFPVVSHDEVVSVYRRHDAGMSRDPVLMLRAVLRVHEAQRPFVAGDPILTAAYSEGRRGWQRYYGRRCLRAARTDLLSGRPLTAARVAACALRWGAPGLASAGR